MLGRRMKHAQRYQEIINAFLRNGLGYIVKDLGLSEVLPIPIKKVNANADLNPRRIGGRVRSCLQELGPTFIKMGQIASTRRDLIPEYITQELEKLQDRVPPFSFDQVRQIIEEELGESIETIFDEFHETPLAAASIGQVHYARLYSKESVAVKIQRPNIRNVIETDLEILEDLARLMELRMDWAKRCQLRDMIEEFAKSLRTELDYRTEGRNAEKIANQFTGNSTICIPKIYWDYSTKKVLTMGYIEGVRVNDLKKMGEKGYNRKVIAERLAQSFFHQILIEGFFHGDPHPGNVLVLPGEVIALLDFGMMGRLNHDMKYQFASLVISLKRGNTDGIIKVVSRMGLIPEDIDMELLRQDIDDLKDKYYDVPLSQISIGEAINDLFTVAFHHRIRIPADLTILGKSLLTLEGVVESLDPEFSIMNVAEPFGERLMKDRFHPKKLAENAWSHIVEYSEIISDLPKKLREITSIMQQGKLRIEITIPELHLLLKKMDRISNRLSFSIVLLSFSIIMVGLIIGSSIGRQSTLLWEIPAIELGFIVATLMFLWLLFSIFRSGKF
ncbi:ABC1 kinase family protein [Bacillus methanolicus]|uniref:ABC1 family protein n=1 Tax=Bacillus methanolicus (strain MGA3 / ATCC 53907) TaxID=796606 RepID=I3EBU1_BACMM|nr:AarF/ABC1/UbiB kinase family protein [Bacillus methanolicus]AIE61642.1 ABC1 family protein [Bacillus methanolicus MGA3]EIJ83962.1 ABC1 family protein [Bacillus methanolicus MGA3]